MIFYTTKQGQKIALPTHKELAEELHISGASVASMGYTQRGVKKRNLMILGLAYKRLLEKAEGGELTLTKLSKKLAQKEGLETKSEGIND